MNTGKLVGLLIMVNIIFGISMLIHNDPYQGNLEDFFENELSIGKDIAGEFSAEPEGVDGQPLEVEGTAGNALSWGFAILNLFGRGLIAWPSDWDNNDIFVQILSVVLVLLRILLYFLIGIQVYQLIKNKKTD